jgi:hypothetical protein
MSWIKPQLDESGILDFYNIILKYLTFKSILVEYLAATDFLGTLFCESWSYVDSYWSFSSAVWNWPISSKYSPPRDSLGRSLLSWQYFIMNVFPLVFTFLLSGLINLLSMLSNLNPVFDCSG